MTNMQGTDKKDDKWEFSPEEELTLHQLLAKKDWVDKQQRDTQSSMKAESKNEKQEIISTRWTLSKDIKLHSWQKTCIEKWFQNEGKGTVKVVTGAGKTIFALGLLSELQKQKEPDLHVAIVVPTIVLMEQWYEEIISKTNIVPTIIGKLGGRYNEGFGKNRRILICVINSAQKKLPDFVEKCGCNDRLLLIIDECHRAGASVMSHVFKTPRRYSLGLSATPERENDGESEADDSTNNEGGCEDAYCESLLGNELGKIIYEMNIEDAFSMGILPPYEIRHYGLPLDLDERHRYEMLRREIKEIRNTLWIRAQSQNVFSDRDFRSWCNQTSGNNEIAKAKRFYLSKIRERKILLYRATSRRDAVINLLKTELKENPSSKAILFHENINEAMWLWEELSKDGIHAVPENSTLSDSIRKKSIELFRQGIANVLVSVRSLIEGFNVPSADIGIVVASNNSVRQRIQTFGRLLRKHKTESGEEKHSVIHVLYIEESVDEIIYEKTDWDSVTGAECNIYFKWNPDPALKESPQRLEGPPRFPLPSDDKIDYSALVPGNKYPGKYDGTEYTTDSEGNIYVSGEKEKIIGNPQGIPELIFRFKNNYGRFRVSPKKNYVLIRVLRDAEWVTLFVTSLNESFQIYARMITENMELEISNLRPGDEMTGLSLDSATEYGYKKKNNGEFIVKKIRRGEIYAHTQKNANDINSGKQAESLISSLSETEKIIGERISKFKVTENKIAITLKNGMIFFIAKLHYPLEFND